jgi:hypothetical protein
MNRGLR